MLALAVLSFLSGVFLGSRYAVLVLVPANLIALTLIAAGAAAFGNGLFAAQIAMVVAAIGLQAGYVCGLGVAHLILPGRRISDVDGGFTIPETGAAANGSKSII